MRFTPLAITALILGAVSVASAASFQNGSFESGLTGWTASGNLAVAGGEGTTDGPNAVVFNSGGANGNAVLAQTFDTVATHTYTVTFDYGSFNLGQPTNVQNLQVEVLNGPTELINSGSGTINAVKTGETFTNNTSIIQIQDTNGGPNLFETAAPNLEVSTFSFTFTATSSASTLTFTDQTGSTGCCTDGILDNVRITPEPASLGLLGVVGVGFIARRRRA